MTYRPYFLPRRLGFGFGVNGSGGLFSIVRNRSSARFSPSRFGSRSSFSNSLARSASDGFRALFMVEVCHG